MVDAVLLSGLLIGDGSVLGIREPKATGTDVFRLLSREGLVASDAGAGPTFSAVTN